MRLKSYTNEAAQQQKCYTIGGTLNRSWCKGQKCISWQYNPQNLKEGGCVHLDNGKEKQ